MTELERGAGPQGVWGSSQTWVTLWASDLYGAALSGQATVGTALGMGTLTTVWSPFWCLFSALGGGSYESARQALQISSRSRPLETITPESW